MRKTTSSEICRIQKMFYYSFKRFLKTLQGDNKLYLGLFSCIYFSKRQRRYVSKALQNAASGNEVDRWSTAKQPRFQANMFHRSTLFPSNRPFALRGHVTSFL